MRLAARVKPAYGPTVLDLAEERLGRRAPRALTVTGTLLMLVIALIVLLALRGGSRALSGSAGSVSFSFRYSGLRRERAPAPYTLLLVAYRRSRLAAQIAIAPLRLPPYSGNATGIEPVLAANYMRALVARTPGVTLQNTGPTIVNGIAGYNFTYTRQVGASSYFGRVIFLTPSVTGDRAGVIVSLLAQPVLAGIVGSGRNDLAGALYEPGQGGVGVLFQPSGLLSEPLATLRIAG